MFLSRLTSVLPYEQSLRILVPIRWATKKAGGVTKNGRDSCGKRLGVKKFGGENVIIGNIIIRQVKFNIHIDSSRALRFNC
jgi:hypothetical protein